MPVPKPKEGQSQSDFMKECMHEVSKNPDRTNEQNVAICLTAWREKHPGAKKPPGKSLQMPAQYRDIKSGEIDKEGRTISFSFSSRTPVMRNFAGFRAYEVLKHGPKAIDIRRFRAGAVPLLLNHDPNKQIGKVTDYQLRGRRAYATAVFGEGELATEIFADVVKGIRSNVSVGYIPEEIRKMSRDEMSDLMNEIADEDDDDDDDDKEDDDDEDVEMFEVSRWQPIEISIVSLPADMTVGIGREAPLYEVRMLTDAPEAREVVLEKVQSMAEPAPIKPEEPKVDVIAENNKLREAEVARWREIQATVATYPEFNEAGRQFIAEGKSIAEFNAYVLANLKSVRPVRSVEPNLGLGVREIQRYSIVRAINRQMLAMQGKGKLDGLEGEVSAELARIHREEPTGFYMPDFALTGAPFIRDMQAGVPALGGVTIQTTVDTNLIPILRNRMAVLKAGARLMTGLVGNLSIPRQNAAATISWNTEIAALTESDQGFDSVLLSPNRVGGWTNYSKKLLAQSSLDIEGIVRDDLIAIIAIAQDNAALNGTGTNQPTGVFNITPNASPPTPPYNYAETAPAITFPTGGFPTWTNVVAFEGNLETGNLPLDESAAYITSPAVKAAWKTYAKADPRATNQFYPAFYWEAGDEVNGHKAFATNQIVGNKVVFGKWNECMIAQWAGLDIVVDIYSLAANAEVRVIANLFCDVKFRYCSAFCCSTNSGVSN